MQGIDETGFARLKLKIESKLQIISTLLLSDSQQERVKGLMSLRKMLVMFTSTERRLFREVEEARNYGGLLINLTQYNTCFLS
jgi:hypothetical protein